MIAALIVAILVGNAVSRFTGDGVAAWLLGIAAMLVMYRLAEIEDKMRSTALILMKAEKRISQQS